MATYETAEAQSATRRFVKQAMKAPLLEHDHERELAVAWRDHQDERALHELTTAYMRLVISMAARFRNYGLPMSDLVQEGNIGLMQAAARFEPDREVRFSTYAAWWIRSAIQDYVLRNWSIVRTGTTAAQKSLFFNLRRLRALISDTGEAMMTRENREIIATKLGVSEREVEQMASRLSANDRSLNAPMSDGIDGGGEWQDFYGILPLLTGSLMIAIVALLIAIPVGIGAAIYTNQFASLREQKLIKPIIEFIQAIPSVVLGFIGIFILGEALRTLSTSPALAWFPGFPMDERLNIFTAGCLLALMSIPTIFSLAEDAINNVPAAYSEASEALGASKLQTTFRVVVPAAFSGILAAVLLGFGRVIGETMVVLLVAGNRIKIPDFSAGVGAFFQPAHTMTGIIAQELGEVPVGSVHYRALFVVGILLFAIVLGINATAHHFTRKMKH